MNKGSSEKRLQHAPARASTWILLIVIILLVTLVRARFFNLPLERDEGEYAYMGQLLLQGVPPYSAAYNMKFPGTYVMYALIMAAFGQTVQGIHIGLLAANCLTVVLIYFLSRKFVTDQAALIAGASYAVLSLSPGIPGFAAHATHFVTLAAVAGALFLQKAVETNRTSHYLASGALFGIAFLMKQPAFFFIAFGLSFLAVRLFSPRAALPHKEKLLRLGSFVIAALVPLLVTLLWLYEAGVLDKFWFWTVHYSAQYVSQIPLSAAFEFFKIGLGSVSDGFWVLWTVAFLGLLIVFFSRAFRDSRLFIVLFALFSFLSVCPGFYFREHYFIPFMPAVSILIGVFFQSLGEKGIEMFKTPKAGAAGIIVFVALILAGVVSEKEYFLTGDPPVLFRQIYGANPFPESVEIARFISEKSSSADRIAVFGSEPEIYFYANRRSATGYIYTYPLMEIQNYALVMQQEMIKEIEASKPKFIVDVHTPASWAVRPDSERMIFGWVQNYLRNNYELVGIADMIAPGRTVYKWYQDAKNYTVQSRWNVLVYERV